MYCLMNLVSIKSNYSLDFHAGNVRTLDLGRSSILDIMQAPFKQLQFLFRVVSDKFPPVTGKYVIHAVTPFTREYGIPVRPTRLEVSLRGHSFV